MPNIGYGSAKATKHVCPDGFKKVLVHNVKVKSAVLCQCAQFVLRILSPRQKTGLYVMAVSTCSVVCSFVLSPETRGHHQGCHRIFPSLCKTSPP